MELYVLPLYAFTTCTDITLLALYVPNLKVYLFVFLFNDAVNSSVYIASNEKVNNKRQIRRNANGVFLS